MILICQNVQRLYFPACLLFEFSVNDNQMLIIESVIKTKPRKNNKLDNLFSITPKNLYKQIIQLDIIARGRLLDIRTMLDDS